VKKKGRGWTILGLVLFIIGAIAPVAVMGGIMSREFSLPVIGSFVEQKSQEDTTKKGQEEDSSKYEGTEGGGAAEQAKEEQGDAQETEVETGSPVSGGLFPEQESEVPASTTPEPAPPGTPVRTFYELTGSPPTAPGLAMKHRVFKEEPEKIVYLTIDDGPSENTGPILDILEREGVKATFFVIGTQVERYPDLLKRAYEQGNAIGNHTYSHNYSEIYQSPEVYLENIKKNEELIYGLIGIRPKIIRTPGGTQTHFSVSYFNAVDAEDYLVYDWNVVTGDATAPLVPVETLIDNVKQQVPGKNRVILLMHDAPGKWTSVQALPEIISFLKKEGYEFGIITPEVAPILFPGGFYQ